MSHIALLRRQYNNPSFPRELLHHCRVRADLRTRDALPLHHSKFFLRRAPSARNAHATELAGWVLLGSHNLSATAFGALQQDGALRIPSIELSVLLATSSKATMDEWALRRFPCDIDAPPYGAGERPCLQY
eukprot:TRINITY_DN2286_c1_g1_i4.p2 TRINITY_DN2286_c1_g1~~TRINITY_DN2286_c1_g1_i4.p2  ORF type:complete len:131 (-),score=18.92 TRINITY_DN2286_c1_g1_i4:154-546(-)